MPRTSAATKIPTLVQKSKGVTFPVPPCSLQYFTERYKTRQNCIQTKKYHFQTIVRSAELHSTTLWWACFTKHYLEKERELPKILTNRFYSGMHNFRVYRSPKDSLLPCIYWKRGPLFDDSSFFISLVGCSTPVIAPEYCTLRLSFVKSCQTPLGLYADCRLDCFKTFFTGAGRVCTYPTHAQCACVSFQCKRAQNMLPRIAAHILLWAYKRGYCEKMFLWETWHGASKGGHLFAPRRSKQANSTVGWEMITQSSHRSCLQKYPSSTFIISSKLTVHFVRNNRSLTLMRYLGCPVRKKTYFLQNRALQSFIVSASDLATDKERHIIG